MSQTGTQYSYIKNFKNFDEFRIAYRNGASSKELGKISNYSATTVRHLMSYLRRIGKLSNEDANCRHQNIKAMKREKNQNEMIRKIEDIKYMFTQKNMNISEIAEYYNCTEQTLKSFLSSHKISFVKSRHFEYPYNIIQNIFNNDITFDTLNIEDSIKGLEHILFKLNKFEKYIIEQYYKYKRTFKNIGDELNLSREYIRQTHNKTLQKLQRLTNSNYIRYGYNTYTNMLKNRTSYPEVFDLMYNVEAHDFSIRTLNALHHAKITDIRELTDSKCLCSIHGLGTKSTNEIIAALSEMQLIS